jgi:hypothetical protein
MVSSLIFCSDFDRNVVNFSTEGEKQDHIGAREYILKVYLRENPDPEGSCYSHFTTATGSMQFAFARVR